MPNLLNELTHYVRPRVATRAVPTATSGSVGWVVRGLGDEAATRGGRVAGWVSGLRSSSRVSAAAGRRLVGLPVRRGRTRPPGSHRPPGAAESRPVSSARPGPPPWLPLWSLVLPPLSGFGRAVLAELVQRLRILRSIGGVGYWRGWGGGLRRGWWRGRCSGSIQGGGMN